MTQLTAEERMAEWQRELSPEELASMLYQARRPGVMLIKTAKSEGHGAPGCWLGGEPTLPPEIEWPWYEMDGRRWAPMHFLAQLDLSQVPVIWTCPEMPRTGTLFFFFDPVYAPNFSLKRGGARVIYTEQDVLQLPRRATPEMPTVDEDFGGAFAYQQNPVAEYENWFLRFGLFEALDENYAENKYYKEAIYDKIDNNIKFMYDNREYRRNNNIRENPSGHVLHSMYGDFPPKDTPDDLVSLLKIWSDPDLNLVFGDHIAAVFWIDRENLKTRNFDAAFVQEGG